MVALEVVPEVFDRVEFGRIRWQEHQRDLVGHAQSPGMMVARPIPDEHGLNVAWQRGCELFQEDVDHVGVEIRTDQPFGLSRLRTGGTHHVQILILGLAHSPRTRTGRGPNPRQRALLTKARFILEEDPQFSIRMLPGDGGQFPCELFLKAAWAMGSASRC